MSHRSVLLSCLVAAAMSCAASEVVAQVPVPSPTYRIIVGYGNALYTPGSLSNTVSDPYYGNGTASASLFAGTSPALSATANGVAGIAKTVPYLSGSSQLTYGFEVIGAPGVQVPVEIMSAGSASSSGGGLGQSIIEFDQTCTVLTCSDPTGDPYKYVFAACSDGGDGICSSEAGSPGSKFSFTQEIFVTPGSPVDIALFADAILYPALSSAQSASAQVDPYIFIDPSFAAASQYQLEISAGLGNSPPSSGGGGGGTGGGGTGGGGTGGGGMPSPVPEPSSLLLFGSGLVAIAGSVRRRLVS